MWPGGQQIHRVSDMTAHRWQFWIDRGGTFTDVIAQSPDHQMIVHKLLSDNPGQYEDASLQGIRDILGIKPGAPIPVKDIHSVRMGTTVATNALLTHTGEPTLLVITKGFCDALRIGDQTRPRIFARKIELPKMLYTAVIEADERVEANGHIVSSLDEKNLKEIMEREYAGGIRSVAIVFLHAWCNPEHELCAALIAKETGFTQISVSHQTSPLMKLVPRGDTTIADAYLTPILRRYIDGVASELEHVQLLFMQSHGGLADSKHFQGKDSILSGPAGGVVGAIKTCTTAGFDKVIGFDMGGTSTDVCHYAGEYERRFDNEIAGVRLCVPMMSVHSIAAGGGSILAFDGRRFVVGPESAGANPGPACYRRGGPLTITDANLMLGRLLPEHFPKVFGPYGDQDLDVTATHGRFAQLAADIAHATGKHLSLQAIALGFIDIAVDNMANAIQKISVQRGYDVSEYTLCSFGGAGAQHACLVADTLGIKQIFIHPNASVLSALGIGLAEVRVLHEQAVEQPIIKTPHKDIAKIAEKLEQAAHTDLLSQNIAARQINIVHTAKLRYTGTDTHLPVNLSDHVDMQHQFEQAHRQQFGFISPEKPLILQSIVAEAIGTGDHLSLPDQVQQRHDPSSPPVVPIEHVSTYGHTAQGDDACAYDTPVFMRDALIESGIIDGPALIVEPNSVIVVEAGWNALMKNGALVLKRIQPLARTAAIGTQVDPIRLTLFNNLFMSIAEQMGLTLGKTATSVNIRERLDFSCAIFDGQGQLVANAPHIPVHLGSMGECVQSVIAARKDHIQPGDVFVTNEPYRGGTHLPDITVITPVFSDDRQEPLFYVASRGHHADIGGITPGSMPPRSTRIEEEGVVLDNLLLVQNGQFQERILREALSSGTYAARNIDQNIADLKAQAAANECGVRELLKMAGHFGLDTVHAYMQHVQDNAEESVRRVIDTLNDGSHTVTLDNGLEINIRISIDRTQRTAVIDFTGTSNQHAGNFNAPDAIARAAVLYVFRTLVDNDIPLNAGCFKPLDIVIPEHCLLDPKYPAAVVAGNVETSQCIVDALFGALGIMAAAQGTMNNFTFGNERYQYYETICGGSGASAEFDGTDAVHTHMTNSRLTDPEVLEWRFPVRVESFEIRHGSGGSGLHTGGCGVIRKIRFKQPMHAAILSNRRSKAPFGLNGGGDGAEGNNYVHCANGTIIKLNGCDEIEMQAGDVMVIETPGGGGFGPMPAG
ncbi:MAG: hydantoinase B/oxoprolinase family protein [Gammaproteobacteria bacterium]|nr:MAG: hydantoinase B/oxoprolinase family protein [Gammaproteobacteria bacterium]